MTDKPNPLDRLLRPDWRDKAAEAGAYWRETFRTPTERTCRARAETAAIKIGHGSARRQLGLCRDEGSQSHDNATS